MRRHPHKSRSRRRERADQARGRHAVVLALAALLAQFVVPLLHVHRHAGSGPSHYTSITLTGADGSVGNLYAPTTLANSQSPHAQDEPCKICQAVNSARQSVPLGDQRDLGPLHPPSFSAPRPPPPRASVVHPGALCGPRGPPFSC